MVKFFLNPKIEEIQVDKSEYNNPETLKLKVWQIIYDQMKIFKESYDHAEPEQKEKIKERFLEAFPSFDELSDYIINTEDIEEEKLLDKLTDNQFQIKIFSEIDTYTKGYKDGKAGILQYSLEPDKENKHELIMYPALPVYEGEDFKGDFTKAFFELGKQVKENPKIKSVVLTTWLFSIDWINQFLDGDNADLISGQGKDLTPGQEHALKINKYSLSKFLNQGIKPEIKRRIFNREEFIERFNK